MNNIKNDKYYICKTIENINMIILYTKNKSYDDFVSDNVLVDATMFRLIQMVENINHISKEFKEMHSSIAWGEISGFRNGIVHQYGKTNYKIVYEIITHDIYNLVDEIKKAI